jgi:hypothetical protein
LSSGAQSWIPGAFSHRHSGETTTKGQEKVQEKA